MTESTGYSIDTNIVIDGRNRAYPPDVFRGVWDRVESLIADGRAIVADEVVFELGRGDDECREWALAQASFVARTDEAIIGLVAAISADHPDWSSLQANWADPFVIAHAQSRRWAVVTNETWSRSPLPERLKIPNVCARYGIECINFVELARREGWNF